MTPAGKRSARAEKDAAVQKFRRTLEDWKPPPPPAPASSKDGRPGWLSREKEELQGQGQVTTTAHDVPTPASHSHGSNPTTQEDTAAASSAATKPRGQRQTPLDEIRAAEDDAAKANAANAANRWGGVLHHTIASPDLFYGGSILRRDPCEDPHPFVTAYLQGVSSRARRAAAASAAAHGSSSAGGAQLGPPYREFPRQEYAFEWGDARAASMAASRTQESTPPATADTTQYATTAATQERALTQENTPSATAGTQFTTVGVHEATVATQETTTTTKEPPSTVIEPTRSTVADVKLSKVRRCKLDPGLKASGFKTST